MKPVVLKVIQRSAPIGEHTGILRDDENVLSKNTVAGPTIDVPIEASCQPSKVCIKDCYAALGPQAIPANLAKQYRVQHTMDADPLAFAERVIREYDRKKHTYLRWNGVGDPTPSAVQTINHIICTRPDIPLWIVSRIPRFAAQIEYGPNAYLHFSLDRTSLERRDAFLALGPKTTNYFFSYQCERDEIPPPGYRIAASVIFHRRYKVTDGSPEDSATCPLNTLDDCTGACAACRRCFNGDAVRMRERDETQPRYVQADPETPENLIGVL